MTPEAAELIGEIEEAHERTQPLLDEATRGVKDAAEFVERLRRELAEGDIEVEQAVEILRRAGLLGV